MQSSEQKIILSQLLVGVQFNINLEKITTDVSFQNLTTSDISIKVDPDKKANVSELVWQKIKVF
jgi:hypothetical protein